MLKLIAGAKDVPCKDEETRKMANGELRQDTITALKEICGKDRVRSDARTKAVYSCDIGAMPRLIQPFVSSGQPGAVVRPESIEDLQELVRYAREQGLALVPRAWASSGYGGVLPPEGSVVVDLTGWNKVLDVDTENLLVTTQPSAIWEEIDRSIAVQGLTLRTYPSSYPASSPAGWLAQGGSGFGAYEYGTFVDNVVCATLVTPTGELKTFEGEDLKVYVSSAEGITGIITEVTFRVRELAPETHCLVSCSSLDSLQTFLNYIHDNRVELWSLIAFNPISVTLKKKLPSRSLHGYETHVTVPDLPETYLVMMAYPTEREDRIGPALQAAVEAAGAEEMSHEAAEFEWEERFAPMRLKRIGPSIIPTEVIVPREKLGMVLQEVEDKISQPFVLEAMLDRDDRVVILGYIPHDERTMTFNVAFELSLAVINIARRHEGSVYSTGLYFRGHATDVLGEEQVEKLNAYKKEVDPQDLFNPGKVIGTGGLLDPLMAIASSLDPLIRPVANTAGPTHKPGEDSQGQRKLIPDNVAFSAYACSRCGYCVPTCEQYAGRGWESDSPRGKYTWIREILEGRGTWDRESVDTILLCTTCEVCNTRCQLHLPVEHNWMQLRGSLVHEGKKGTFPPFEMMGAALMAEGDIWAAKREHRDAWVPDDLRGKLHGNGEILYFPGCTASYVEHDIAEATTRLLLDAGYDLAYMGNDENCCGIPMKMAGRWDIFETIYERNVGEARRRGVKTIVTSCPACALTWKDLYRDVARKRGESYDFEVKHYSELLAEAIERGDLELPNALPELGRVAFHDSCHAGRAQGIYEEPRAMLSAIPDIEMCEMAHNREEGICCGSVLTLVGEMEVAPVLGKHRLDEAVDAGADTVVAICPCCQVQLRDSIVKNNLPLQVEDLSRVVALSRGYDIPSSSDESLKQWGYFEKFIPLMRPQNMAKVMEQVFPQMLDAMPLGMGQMMVPMAKTEAGRSMISAMMPLMFPKMAPGILDRVMPDLIDTVRDTVGEIPDDMNELLPDLLPVTMEAMMPSYLPELIPHVVPLFVDFLKEKAHEKAGVMA